MPHIASIAAGSGASSRESISTFRPAIQAVRRDSLDAEIWGQEAVKKSKNWGEVIYLISYTL